MVYNGGNPNGISIGTYFLGIIFKLMSIKAEIDKKPA